MAGMREIQESIERSVFEGRVRNRSRSVCACHGKEVYVDPRDYYAGIPSCSVTRRALGPDGTRAEKLPDLILPGYTGELPDECELWKP